MSLIDTDRDPVPFDPSCGREAGEVSDYDHLIEEAMDAPVAVLAPEHLAAARIDMCRREEGTLNPENGHFLCMECYIRAGMPSLPFPERWVCP